MTQEEYLSKVNDIVNRTNQLKDQYHRETELLSRPTDSGMRNVNDVPKFVSMVQDHVRMRHELLRDVVDMLSGAQMQSLFTKVDEGEKKDV
ncbi:MAG: hypothetical protein UT24_C0011G0052 [Candidatus Woesebacteria bacterium GW2011_GWB1_39_12]|uniref:Uncharacterized protein n=1 Tax=Candidatus Woesebacteria bacterium GW2011_GWB1_39_12 TaxID=1618574 RepID=A0A0G0M926_9BACT|nr:MAG: hypothetical protein UT24_C0011G0052 [Candidatus Woesebacteria bacterium GW2011_GWB1_39_12]